MLFAGSSAQLYSVDSVYESRTNKRATRANGMEANFRSMAARLMWSKVPMPSMLTIQARASKSHAARNKGTTHSVPAPVESAY